MSAQTLLRLRRKRGRTDLPSRKMVVFTSALLRGEHISHATLDGERTLCGRTGWFAEDPWNDFGPCCLKCSAALDKIDPKRKEQV